MKTFKQATARTAFVSLAFFGALAHLSLAASVSNPSTLGPNDSVVCGVAAPNTSQFTVLTTGGLGVTLSEPTSNFQRTQQFPPDGWDGNFPAGTNLITPQEPSGPATIALAVPTSSDASIVLGVLDGTAEVTSVQISTTNVTSNDNFAFGNLELRDVLKSWGQPASIGTVLRPWQASP